MRWRLFALLGLSAAADACSPAAGEPPIAAGPVVDVTPTGAVSEPRDEDEDEPDPDDEKPRLFAACETDHHREWICGSTGDKAAGTKTNPYATCPATSDRVVRRAATPLGKPPTMAMPLDAPLTSTYRDHQRTRFRNKKPEDLCCYSDCVVPDIEKRPDVMPKGYRELKRCITQMDSTTVPAAENAHCPAAIAFDDGPEGPHAAAYDAYMTRYYNESLKSGSQVLPGMQLCCYRSLRKSPDRRPGLRPAIIRGRALRGVDGSVTTAPPQQRSDWSRSSGRSDGSASWLDDAAAEHASVASFSVLALQLLVWGAPLELVTDAHRAAQDEIEHARLSYALAPGSVGPGPLDHPGRAAASLEALIVGTFIDGCVGETVAALDAHRAATRGDPALRAVQRRIAGDEERHAALAWRVIAWAISQHRGARDIFSAAVERLAAKAKADDDAVQHVVIPCAYALLLA